MNTIESTISEVLKINIDKVNDNLAYQSIPEWDSFQHVILLLEIEKKYGVLVTSKDAETITTVKSIKRFIEQNCGVKEDNLFFEDLDTENLNVNKSIGIEPTIYRGLNGIIIDKTSISHIDGENGKLYYRGYLLESLVKNSSFEEVSYLMLFGKLPSNKELEEYDRKLRSRRKLSQDTKDLIYNLRNLSPLNVLQTVFAASIKTSDNYSFEQALEQGIHLIAQTPTIITTHNAYRLGKSETNPNDMLAHSDNFLYMLHGEVPDKLDSKMLDQDFIIHMDHGSNASSFVSRVAMSTKSDLVSAITAAISTFSGSLHGGAIEQVMKMLIEISSPNKVNDYIERKFNNNDPIMGFGHRVYKGEDPRASLMKIMAEEISERKRKKDKLLILSSLINSLNKYSSYGLNVNVDCYAGIIYDCLEIPLDNYVPLFIISRITGWVTQSLEQFKNNVLIRPLLQYEGPLNLTYLPVSQRNDLMKEEIIL